MMKFVSSAFEDADVFVYLVEPKDHNLKDEKFLIRLQETRTPVLLVINKIDTLDQDALEVENAFWTEKLPNAEVVPISALNKFNTDYLLKRFVELIPVSPAYYDKDAITDKPERFFVSEIVREKILLNYKKEIPYSVEVVVEEFKEEEDIIRIRVNIFVARESQKGIIIGHQGKMLKKVGTEARKDLETFFQKKVFIENFVKVNKDWRSDNSKLKRFGY
jgi:GTP-binding protein Era